MHMRGKLRSAIPHVMGPTQMTHGSISAVRFAAVRPIIHLSIYNIYMHMYMYVCMCMYMYTYMHMYKYMYMCRYMHTYV